MVKNTETGSGNFSQTPEEKRQEEQILKVRKKRNRTTYVNKIYVNPSPEISEMLINPAWCPAKLTPDLETLKQIGLMARVHCTEQEMANIFGVSTAAFSDFRNMYPEVRETISKNRDQGRLSLRHKQFQMALEQDNTQMAIWLGKQYLGQSDKTHTENNVNLNVLKSIMDLQEDDYDYSIDSSNKNGNSNDE